MTRHFYHQGKLLPKTVIHDWCTAQNLKTADAFYSNGDHIDPSTGGGNGAVQQSQTRALKLRR